MSDVSTALSTSSFDAATSLREVRRALESAARKAWTQGLQGAARGYLLAALSRSLRAPLVCVAADEEGAGQLAADLAFFLGGEGSLLAPTVLRLPADEVTP